MPKHGGDPSRAPGELTGPGHRGRPQLGFRHDLIDDAPALERRRVHDLFARSGVDASQLEDAHARISHRQRRTLHRNARRLAKRSDIGLLAGARQRISDYGIYGYAMVSSRTFGDALLFSLDHITLAGPAVRQISFRIEGGTTAILRSHGLDTLGDLLPFAAEFWRSSMTALFSRVRPSPASEWFSRFPRPCTTSRAVSIILEILSSTWPVGAPWKPEPTSTRPT
ncbi:AraC family transcriptional regulator ligand-binding domain-containing protein [Bradyrhizobium ganzhouense]|uniref:AraC family transcriptional regulator ligand-binding domain-containing protein n=1 Tax=Bradyrhizobium ganzhouense TaxID=1179767 RepID=UPI003CEBC53C